MTVHYWDDFAGRLNLTGGTLRQEPAFTMLPSPAGNGIVVPHQQGGSDDHFFIAEITHIMNDFEFAHFEELYAKAKGDWIYGKMIWPIDWFSNVNIHFKFNHPPKYRQIGESGRRIIKADLECIIVITQSLPSQHFIFAGKFPPLGGVIANRIVATPVNTLVAGLSIYNSYQNLKRQYVPQRFNCVVLMSCNEFMSWMRWWNYSQCRGAKPFKMLNLSNATAGWQIVRATGGWRAKMQASDVVVEFGVELTNPIHPHHTTNIVNDTGLTLDDVRQIRTDTDAIWRTLARG